MMKLNPQRIGESEAEAPWTDRGKSGGNAPRNEIRRKIYDHDQRNLH